MNRGLEASGVFIRLLPLEIDHLKPKRNIVDEISSKTASLEGKH